MGKYVLAYKGGSMPQSEAEQAAVMTEWMGWFGQLGAAVIDGGNPFGPAKSVAGDGSVKDGGGGLTGYSVIEATSLDDAATKAKGCPVLAAGGTVDVYETIEVG